MMADDARENRLAEEFLRCYTAWSGEHWQVSGRPDRAQSQTTACDFSIQREPDGAEGVLEIFEIRRGDDSGAEDAIWTRVVVQMEKEFRGKLPGTFSLTTAPRIEVSKKGAPALANALREDIAAKAATLREGEACVLPGVRFDARLTKLRNEGSSLLVARFQGAAANHESIERLLSSHAERLRAAKSEGNRTILVIEDPDWPIRSNWNAVAEEVRRHAEGLDIQVDEIFVIQTHAGPDRPERISVAYRIRRGGDGFTEPEILYAPPVRPQRRQP